VDNPGMTSALRWDIFCKVIDNYGDLGVCWRLARQLAARGQTVRLWIDDASALRWMAPQGSPGVEVRPWQEPLALDGLAPGDVLVEAFGCEIPCAFVQLFAGWSARHPTTWLNLEYLSAEPYVERSHALPSPVLHGPGRGLTKHFFYPGFTPRTGGLLREPDLPARQARFERRSWLQGQGIAVHADEVLVSLFCYEPPALPALLRLLAVQQRPARLLVTAGRAAAAVQASPLPATLAVSFLPWLPQDDYDHLLWSCDLNFVRGEDSLVRALWAARPFVWQIYPQHDDAHHTKLEALLAEIDAPEPLRRFHRTWNGIDTQPLQAPDLTGWETTVAHARQGLLAQPDLVSRLLEFVAQSRR